MIKKNIGFYLPPLPEKLKKKNDIKKYGYLTDEYLEDYMDLFKNDNFNMIIIPYNINSILINKYLSSIDGLIVCGNHKGNHNNDKDHRQHYSTMKNIYKNIININKIRPLPVYFHCYGYEIIINIIENKKYMDNNLLIDLQIKEDYFYKQNIFLDKSYQNFINEYSMTIGFLFNNFKKTVKLKKEYDVISLLTFKKNQYIIDIMKHKFYPIFIGKATIFANSFYGNKKIIEEFLNYSELSYQYRKKNYSYSILPKIKYKSLYYPGKNEYNHLGDNNEITPSFRIDDIFGYDVIFKIPEEEKKIRLYDYTFS
jgi:hypothetical protein